MAILMQSLDSTIATVALPYMQGSLSASSDQITSVLTSYITAAAMMTAPVGWLSARFGMKDLYLLPMVGFTIASMLCGIAEWLSYSRWEPACSRGRSASGTRRLRDRRCLARCGSSGRICWRG